MIDPHPQEAGSHAHIAMHAGRTGIEDQVPLAPRTERTAPNVNRGKIPGINHLHAIRTFEKAGLRIIREGKPTVMSDGTRILTTMEAYCARILVCSLAGQLSR